MKEKITDYIILWFTGGIVYFYLEILFRGFSHVSMIICGGICFVTVGKIGQILMMKECNIFLKLIMIMFVGSIIISSIEFLTGYIVNIWLNLAVWDYSDMKYNYKGQVCLEFTILWSGISLACVYLYYIIQYYLFEDTKKEEQ